MDEKIKIVAVPVLENMVQYLLEATGEKDTASAIATLVAEGMAARRYHYLKAVRDKGRGNRIIPASWYADIIRIYDTDGATAARDFVVEKLHNEKLLPRDKSISTNTIYKLVQRNKK